MQKNEGCHECSYGILINLVKQHHKFPDYRNVHDYVLMSAILTSLFMKGGGSFNHVATSFTAEIRYPIVEAAYTKLETACRTD